MKSCVITLSALFAVVSALEAAESKELKKSSLAATEQLFSNPKVLEISVEVPCPVERIRVSHARMAGNSVSTSSRPGRLPRAYQTFM